MGAWQAYLDENQGRFLDELVALLRIPSISALPEHAADVAAAAAWIAQRLRQAGLEHAHVEPTGGHPLVYADWLHIPDKPTVLIYGHLDVQPVDPLDEWVYPPFEPTVADDRLYARGASDDKGNMLVPILAIEALLATEGTLPLNVRCLFEGQEEIGSPQLAAWIDGHRELLACDVVLNADSGQWSETEPALGVALRGLAACQIDVEGPNSDLHSGSYGGAVMNPIHALVQLLDDMRGRDGRIQVDGFYDDVVPLSPADRRLIAEIPFDQNTYVEELGVPGLWGEEGYTPRERTWARPTLELNGIWGGFQGVGSKTVLPRSAHAKITCRLVPDQEAERIVAGIAAFCQSHCPPGVRVTVQTVESGAKPYQVPRELPANQIIAEVLTSAYGRVPYYERSGGSIAICAMLLDMLGAYTITLGFGLHDERYHAPNEFYRLSSFSRGQSVYCQALHALGRKLV
jgi:acetylornithine deacetylase/succinyl-diaminopimelate desuccinylase-like protein